MNKKPIQTKILFQEQDKFNKPNILINVVNNKMLSHNDKRIYNVLLRKLIDQDLKDFQTNFITTSITQIAYELGIKNRSDIHNSLRKLKQTEIRFEHLDRGEIIEYDTNLIVGKGVYKQKEDSVVIEFSRVLTKEILLHHERYTKLDLIEMNNLKVSHSLTMYERMKSTLSGHPYQRQNYTEEQLRQYLNLEDKYQDIRRFNEHVIKKIIKDINEHTSMDLELLKIEKEGNTRVYKFMVKIDEFNISFTQFKNTLINLVKKYHKPITYKHKTKNYILEQQSDFGFERDLDNYYWINENTGKTIDKDKSFDIWDELFIKYKRDYFKFIEEELGIDTEDWLSIERKELK